MADYQVLFFFEGIQAAKSIGTGASVGWVEVWYMFAGPADLNTAIMDPNIDQYIKLRTASLAPIYRMSFVRISDTASPRNFKVRAVTGGFGTNGGATPAQVQCAILVDFMRLSDGGADPSHHRRFLVRGLPSEVIVGNVLNTAVPQWSPLSRFFNFVGFHPTGTAPPVAPTLPDFTTNLGIRYQNPATGKTNITNLSAGANNRHLLMTPTVPPPANPNARYRITGVKGPGLSQLNRAWPFWANQTGPPAVTDLGPARTAVVPSGLNIDNPGRVQLMNPLYNRLHQYVIIGLRNKKTGRVFRQLRGRSRNRG